MSAKQTNEPWAVFNKVGAPVFVGMASSERDVWIVYTGWGSDDEIEARKQAGFSACPVGLVRRPVHGKQCGCTDCT